MNVGQVIELLQKLPTQLSVERLSLSGGGWSHVKLIDLCRSDKEIEALHAKYKEN